MYIEVFLLYSIVRYSTTMGLHCVIRRPAPYNAAQHSTVHQSSVACGRLGSNIQCTIYSTDCIPSTPPTEQHPQYSSAHHLSHCKPSIAHHLLHTSPNQASTTSIYCAVPVAMHFAGAPRYSTVSCCEVFMALPLVA